MNKKHLIYSLQYAAVLASVLTFSSCKKDEFTAEQALDIENKRKQFQFDLDEKAKDNEAARANFMMWQARKIDSLQRVNAGGQVFYSVAVVPGGSTAFGQGRYEEVGLDDIEVTVEQYGFVYTEKTKKGIAYFKKPLFSGEATVTVDASGRGYTSVSYISNLTPDGGVPNDGTVFVGNIIPVFNNDPEQDGADDNMAMISGRALADLDLTDVRSTDGTSVEENVPDGVSFSAVIDVNRTEFKDKYLRENFEEGGIHIGGSGNTPGTGVATKSGFIQRIAYEKASTVARVSNGEYTMKVAATASGLPMKMRYSDFAYDRRYVNNFGNTVEERYLYGPEVGYAVDFTVGSRPLRYDYDVNLVQTDATVTAALTRGTSVNSYTDPTTGDKWLVPLDGIGANGTENRYLSASVNANNNAGAYLRGPKVTFSAPTSGTTAEGTAWMYPSKEDAAAPVFGTNAYYNSSLAVTGTVHDELNLRGVKGIKLSNLGSGYTTPPTVTLTPNFPTGEGTGSLQASSSGISYIRVINGGYGMKYNSVLHNVAPTSHAFGVTNPAWTTADLSTAANSYTDAGTFTGVLPEVLFNGNGDAPIGGTAASAQLVLNTTIGTVDEIYVLASGSGYNAATSAITFNTGKDALIDETSSDGTALSGSEFLVVAGSGTDETLRFLTGTGAIGALALNAFGSTDVALDEFASASTNVFYDDDITFIGGSNFTFVPQVTASSFRLNYDASAGTYPNTALATPSGLSFTATVQGGTGKVKSISISSGNIIGGVDVGDEVRANITIAPYDCHVTAQAYLSGSGIDNYIVTNTGSGYSNVDATAGDGSGAFDASNLYDYYTYSGESGSIAINALAMYNDRISDYDVEFFGATGLGGNSVVNPTAVPVFQSGGQTLAGIRIFNPGANIAPAATAGGTAIQWRIVPRGYKAGIITAQLTPATLTFTIADGGLGYAVRPDVILTTDKLTYIQTAALNKIDNYKFNINGAGTITGLWFSPMATGAAGVLTLLNDPASGTLSTPIVTVAAQEAELYDKSSFYGGGNNAYYHFRSNGSEIIYGQHGGTNLWGFPSGWDTAILADDVAWDTYANDTEVSIMHWPQATPAFGETGEIVKAYYTPFTLDVTYGLYVDATNTLRGVITGSGASATAVLNPSDGEVSYIEMVSGGSGYLSSITFNRNPITTAFTVFGGPDGYIFGGGAIFETYSGIQYVRDIHYGVGRRIH